MRRLLAPHTVHSFAKNIRFFRYFVYNLFINLAEIKGSFVGAQVFSSCHRHFYTIFIWLSLAILLMSFTLPKRPATHHKLCGEWRMSKITYLFKLTDIAPTDCRCSSADEKKYQNEWNRWEKSLALFGLLVVLAREIKSRVKVPTWNSKNPRCFHLCGQRRIGCFG